METMLEEEKAIEQVSGSRSRKGNVRSAREAEEGRLVSSDFIYKLRSKLGLTQSEFAQLLGVTNITVNAWERRGVDNIRGSSFYALRSIVALVKQAIEHPDFLTIEELKQYFKKCANRDAVARYTSYNDQIANDYLWLVNSGTFHGVLAAILLDKHLKKKIGSENMPKLEDRLDAENEILEKI